MKHSIIFRSIAILLFLTFIGAFVSYHAGVIHADNLLLFSDDTTKRNEGRRWSDSIRLNHPDQYRAMTSKSGVIIGSITFDTDRIDSELVLPSSSIQNSINRFRPSDSTER